MVRTPALSLPRAPVQSLVGELKSHKLHGTAKKKKQWVLWRPVVLKECWWIQEPRVKLTLGIHCGFDRVRVTPHSLLNRVGSSP